MKQPKKLTRRDKILLTGCGIPIVDVFLFEERTDGKKIYINTATGRLYHFTKDGKPDGELFDGFIYTGKRFFR